MKRHKSSYFTLKVSFWSSAKRSFVAINLISLSELDILSNRWLNVYVCIILIGRNQNSKIFEIYGFFLRRKAFWQKDKPENELILIQGSGRVKLEINYLYSR